LGTLFSSNIGILVTILAVIGSLWILRLTFRIVGFLWLHCLRPRTNFACYGAKKGSWAVVTGASDGIGRAFAEKLAKRGFNIVMISRTASKLKELQQAVETKYRVLTRSVAMDCSVVSSSTLQLIQQAVQDLDVSILINNVGVSLNIPAEHSELTEDEVTHLINVNCLFTSQITRVLIPILRQRKSSRGLIVTLSSTSGVFPIPLLSIYSASKAFDSFFSRSLRTELLRSKIDCLSLTPHFVVSSMSGFKRSRFMVPTAERFVDDALDKLGAGGSEQSPYWPHDLYIRIGSLIPESITSHRSMKMLQKAREKLLARPTTTTGAASHNPSPSSSPSPSSPSSSTSSETPKKLKKRPSKAQ